MIETREEAGTPEPMPGPDPEPAVLVRRFARLRRSGNPDVLWPDVSRPRRVAAAHHLASVVTAALTGRPAHVDGDDLPAQGVAAFIAGVGPLLGWWIAQGRLAAHPAAASLFATHLNANRRRAARLAERTVRAVAMLRDLGLEPVVLKGLHLATCYPDPAARVQGDIDLLLPSHARTMVERHLRARRWVPKATRHDARRTTWRAPDTPALPERLDLLGPNDPWTLDLHWTLDRARGPGVARMGDAESVATEPLTVGSEVVTVLDAEDLFLFMALQTSLTFDELQLIRIVDLVLAARGRPDAWSAACDTAGERGLLDVLYPAAALAARLDPDAVPAPVLDRLRAAATTRLRTVVDRTDPGTLLHRDARTLRQKLMWARDAGETARVLFGMLLEYEPRTWWRRLALLWNRFRYGA